MMNFLICLKQQRHTDMFEVLLANQGLSSKSLNRLSKGDKHQRCFGKKDLKARQVTRHTHAQPQPTQKNDSMLNLLAVSPTFSFGIADTVINQREHERGEKRLTEQRGNRKGQVTETACRDRETGSGAVQQGECRQRPAEEKATEEGGFGVQRGNINI